MKTLAEQMNLRGRRALITGAAGGLGRVMADTLGELGADLILVDRPGCDWGSIHEELRQQWSVDAQLMEFDLEIEHQRESLIESVKADGLGLNILINNAAFVGTSDLLGWAVPFEQQRLDTWRRALEVNLSAVFHLCQGFTPQLRASIGGNIINIASIYGECGPDWRLYQGTGMGSPAAYAASKGGLIQLTRWMATTLAPEVRVNAISPGGIYRNQEKIFVTRYRNKTPLARMANEDDVRGVMGFLCTDASSYITGEIVSVDGGWGVW